MEQPRFGGVALPPLSTCGEGKSPEFVTDKMEPTQLTTRDLQCVIPEGQSDDVRGANLDVHNIMEVLRQLGMSPELQRHQLKHERQRTTETQSVDDGVYCKNLLLKDKKGRAYLVLSEENATVDLHVVKYHLNVQGNLHLASKDSLWKLLRVLPGAVSPLALIHCPGGDVRVFIDAALVKTIDPDRTTLYFHPLTADLQVGLTLSELEAFLGHCHASLELLPSLTSYSARRRYGSLAGGCRYKHKPERTVTTELEDAQEQEVPPEEAGAGSLQQPKKRDEVTDQADMTFTQHSDLFQQLEVVSVQRALAKGNASDRSVLACRSVYLKDKRDNYFLLICHTNQKVDFSTLKKQLKPRKKIVPLDREELWSVLRLYDSQEHPFVLAELKQPRFLVAICDNLYYQGNPVVAFPHPTDPSLRLEIALKHLETFITNTSHDLVTIQMKGKIEQLQATSVTPACSSSPQEAPLNKAGHRSEAGSECTPSLHPEGASYCQHLHSQTAAPPLSPPEQGHNLFHQLTAPLRLWVWRCIRRLVQLFDHYLPSQVSAVLSRSLVWNRILASGTSSTPDCVPENREHANGPTSGEQQREAKIAQLRQLIDQSSIAVELADIQPPAPVLTDDAERCRMLLLEDALGQPFVVLCTEEDDPSQRNLRRLRRAFRCRTNLRVADDARLQQHLSGPENPSVAWTQDDLHPLALIHMDLHALQRPVSVGMTGALYVFSGTTLSFDLPPLGVALRMSCDDLKKLIRRLGFRVIYLP